MAPRRDDGRLRGIALTIGGTLFMVLMAAATKHLRVEGYSPAQIIWARFVFHLALLPLLVPIATIPSLLRSRRLSLQIARSLMGLFGAIIFVVALRYITIAEIVAITFVAPILITILAGPLLGERVDWRNWLAVGLAFIGMLAIVKPGGGAVQWAAVLPVVLTLTYALNQIFVRILGNLDPPATTFAYFALIGSVATTFAVPFDWRTPDMLGWAVLIASGICGGLGHLLMIRAYERAAVSALAPFLYTELLWAIAFGYALFGDVLDPWALGGALVIVAAGLFIVARERRARA